MPTGFRSENYYGMQALLLANIPAVQPHNSPLLENESLNLLEAGFLSGATCVRKVGGQRCPRRALRLVLRAQQFGKVWLVGLSASEKQLLCPSWLVDRKKLFNGSELDTT